MLSLRPSFDLPFERQRFDRAVCIESDTHTRLSDCVSTVSHDWICTFVKGSYHQEQGSILERLTLAFPWQFGGHLKSWNRVLGTDSYPLEARTDS